MYEVHVRSERGIKFSICCGIFAYPRRGDFFMFTGIITHTGKLEKKEGSVFTFFASSDVLKKLKKGESISVNGCCLTVTDMSVNTFSTDVMQETEKKTMLGLLKKGDVVNFELPATPTSFLSGHIVQGHIDGVGKIETIKEEGNSRLLTIFVPKDLRRYIVEKGSIAVNGISLTVIKEEKDYFTVGIIPHTWENTMLINIKVGDLVNIETDIMAKYIEKLWKQKI